MTAMTSSCPIGPAASQPAPARNNSLDEERREVFESVLSTLARDPLDADRLAAGSYLLRHLSRTAATPV
jgi:hypothetical protein